MNRLLLPVGVLCFFLLGLLLAGASSCWGFFLLGLLVAGVLLSCGGRLAAHTRGRACRAPSV
jgi:hypothetical protein